MRTQPLSVLVEDRPGVLARVASLFSRRGYNIASLAVGPTERDGRSRITLVTEVPDADTLEQIVKQLNKLIEVIKVIELDDLAVKRELLLIKVKSDPSNRSQVIDTVHLFRGKAVDVDHESITIEATGGHDKLEALIKMLSPYGIIELVQSGQVAVGRGHRTMTDRVRPVRRQS